MNSSHNCSQNSSLFQLIQFYSIPFWFRIMEILQSGLMDYWHRRSLPTMSAKEKCNFLNEHHKERPLTLDDLRGAFLILSIGLILAIGAFLLEIIHSKIK